VGQLSPLIHPAATEVGGKYLREFILSACCALRLVASGISSV